VGRRKTAVARVRLTQGKGELKVNKIKGEEYFPLENHIRVVQRPFRIANCVNKYDVYAILRGGGFAGQADALAMGISRALIKAEPILRGVLKKAGLLRRDPREKERKKYGQKGARKRFQFSKR
jgi:small subunit ribosomal protein S9